MASVAASAGLTCCESQWKGRPLLGVGNGNAFINPSRFNFSKISKKTTTLVTAAKSLADKIPKQFKEDNLKEGVMENFKSFPQHLYGLSPSQLDFFSSEGSPIQRQAARVTEESLSSAKYYMEGSGMQNLANLQSGSSGDETNLGSLRSGGLTRMPRGPPPDLPSLLLASRIVFIGMPLVPVVTELICAQLMYLDSESSEPINIYINSAGTLNDKGESIALDNDAFAIADSIALCNCQIYTLNIAKAFGHAAMLLALGHPGCRYLLPHAFTQIYLPSVNQSVGPSIDMYVQAKELERNTNKYIHFLSLGTDKSKEEISRDLKNKPRLLLPQHAIDYGLADKIMPKNSQTLLAEARTYGKKLDPAKAEEMRAARSVAPPMTGASAPPAGRP